LFSGFTECRAADGAKWEEECERLFEVVRRAASVMSGGKPLTDRTRFAEFFLPSGYQIAAMPKDAVEQLDRLMVIRLEITALDKPGVALRCIAPLLGTGAV
jgi:hypothetical protein